MAKHTPQQFADLCGMSLANISTYTSRKKIVKTKNLYDDADPLNQYFVVKMREKHNLPPLKLIDPKKNIDKKAGSKPPGTPPPSDDDHSNQESVSRYALDKQKKELDIKKTAEEIEWLKNKNAKAAGEMLPTEMVKQAFAIHFKNVITSQKIAIDKILVELTKKKKYTRKEVAEIRGRMLLHLNTSVAESVIESKKSIKNIISEVSVKREVGEHE